MPMAINGSERIALALGNRIDTRTLTTPFTRPVGLKNTVSRLELPNNQSEKRPRRGRPSRAPDDADARRRLIRAGLVFLTERGYSTAGVNEILREAGVPKGCFYHYFRDKADFGKQVIGAYQDYFSRKLDRCFQDQSLTPLQQLQSFVDGAIEGMSRHAFRRGCLVGNLGQEMGTLPQEFRDQLIVILEDWQLRTAECLTRAQEQGDLAAHHDVDGLARFFWIGWEGAVLRAKLEQKAEPLATFAAGFFKILKH